MAPTIWNPDLCLQISMWDKPKMFCVGRAPSKFNARCRWQVRTPKYLKIRNILEELSQIPPDEVTVKDLEDIVRLGLCEEVHNGDEKQIDDVVDYWDRIIRQGPAKDYKRYRQLKKKNSSLITELEEASSERQVCFELLVGREKAETEMAKGHLDDLLKSWIDEQQANPETAGKLRATKRALKNIKTESMTLQDTIADLQTQLREAKDQERGKEEVEAEKDRLLDKLAMTKRELHAARQEKAELQAAYEGLSSQDVAGQTELRTAQEELIHLREKVENQTRELNRLNVDARGTQALVKQLRNEVKDKAKDSRNSNSLNIDLTATNTQLKFEVQQAQETIEANREEKESLAAKVSSTLETLHLSQTELQKALEAKEALEKNLSATKQEISELRAQLMDLEEQQSSSVFKKLACWLSTKWSTFSKWLARVQENWSPERASDVHDSQVIPLQQQIVNVRAREDMTTHDRYC